MKKFDSLIGFLLAEMLREEPDYGCIEQVVLRYAYHSKYVTLDDKNNFILADKYYKKFCKNSKYIKNKTCKSRKIKKGIIDYE